LWRDALGIFVLALAVRGVTMLAVREPGYMDAYYYYDMAEALYRGRGLTEHFIWNWLTVPETVVHPGNVYWMPLASLVVWPFFGLFGAGFTQAQVPMALLSAAFPVLAYAMAREVFGSRRIAWATAVLTLAGGTYFLYWVNTDNLTVYGLPAFGALWLGARALQEPARATRYLAAAGALVGLAHLARPDAPLLLVALALAVGSVGIGGLRTSGGRGTSPRATVPGRVEDTEAAAPADRAGDKPPRYSDAEHPREAGDGHPPYGRAGFGWTVRTYAGPLAAALLAYLAVMAPWFARNLVTFGSPYPADGSKALYLTEYNDLFAYGKALTLATYLDWGVANILGSKLRALAQNLGTLAVLLLAQAPFAVIGLVALRRRLELRAFLCYFVLLYLVMSLAFTFPGPRGSFLHSLVAGLPFLMAAAVYGTDRAVGWLGRRRGWGPEAVPIFSWALVALTLGATIYGVVTAVPNRNDRYDLTRRMVGWLEANAAPGEPAMVLDPPSIYYFSGRPTIVATNNPPAEAAAVMRRYGARYVFIERDRHLAPWHDWWLGKEAPADLALVGEGEGFRVYALK
jgi:hypothetical protein